MTYTGLQLNAYYTLDSFIIELNGDELSINQEDIELKEWMALGDAFMKIKLDSVLRSN